MVTIEEIRRAQRAEGPATIMAITTANPPNCIEQSTFAEFYFRITNSEDKVELKERFKRTCEKSMIKKRYTYLNEEFLEGNPNICAYSAPSLEARQDMVNEAVPKLAKEAASEAIKEWARPVSDITHLVFCSSAGIAMPGADYELAKLLGLRPSAKRIMLYHSGCYAGGTVLRMAKDIAENNRGARVLVVSCELFLSYFRGPSETNINSLNIHSAFGDGAAAMVVGSDLIPNVEKPLFEIAFANQSMIPESDGTFYVHLREAGFMFHEFKDISEMIPNNIEKIMVEAFQPLGISDWNSIFWVSHPGGRGLLDRIEEKLGLNPEKLLPTRHMLSEYGNMGSANVFFTLNEIRKRSIKDAHRTTGQGLEWGVLFGYGPGLTVETVVLHSVST